ncbi:class I SAM-dependent methyltransferase [soil metagenome]
MKHRVVVPELMDDPKISRATHEVALAGLARLNRWSRSDAGLWSLLQPEAKQVAPGALRILDLATGSGDLPVRLACRARRARVNLALAGCDVSLNAIEIARQQAKKRGVNVEFFQRDVIHQELPAGYDVIITSLFLHHLTEPDAIQLLRRMADFAERLVIVNDLNRGWFNLGLVTIASRVLSRSFVVHHDGPASVRAAFTRAEAQQLAARAGLINAEVVSQTPCRWLLSWRKPA